MKQYKKDKRSPQPSSATASKVMSAIKGKHTKPELLFRKLLIHNKLSGYRVHWKVPGKPDIVYVGKKLAIFIHGCYWHRCPTCNLPLPKSNSEFWEEKFNKNVQRDVRKRQQLEESGWTVFIFWECSINQNPDFLIEQIQSFLKRE